MVFAVFFLIVSFGIVCVDASYVHAVNERESIQSAINNASSGDTIFVNPGTYAENLVIDKPIFLPKLVTIQDFFLSQQQSVIPEKLVLVNYLYQLYIEKTKSTERFDDFYQWGELLLNDFDDIDKYHC